MGQAGPTVAPRRNPSQPGSTIERFWPGRTPPCGSDLVVSHSNDDCYESVAALFEAGSVALWPTLIVRLTLRTLATNHGGKELAVVTEGGVAEGEVTTESVFETRAARADSGGDAIELDPENTERADCDPCVPAQRRKPLGRDKICDAPLPSLRRSSGAPAGGVRTDRRWTRPAGGT